MDDAPQRYPLDWPPAQPRTAPADRAWGPYRVSQDRAQKDLVDELRLLGACDVVLSTNQRLRRDGLPYASQGRIEDPGVAVYWRRDGRDYCIACDGYSKLEANMRACGIAIHHLRRLEQAAPAFAERAFSGFARLPASIVTERPWRTVLCLEQVEHVDRAAVMTAYRALARERHPDASTGSDSAMAELNSARDRALREVGDA